MPVFTVTETVTTKRIAEVGADNADSALQKFRKFSPDKRNSVQIESRTEDKDTKVHRQPTDKELEGAYSGGDI